MLTLAGVRKYNRYQAALGHFGLSLLIFIILGYLVYFCWYPQPLFSIDAGWQGMRILAFVDFVLGPCITLVIFNPKKKELLKDLAIIALIQISALSYGVYHVYQSRPAIVVYADNQFRTVALSQLEFFKLPNDITSDIPLLEPKYFYLDIPRDNIIILEEQIITPENMDQVLDQYDKQRRPLAESNQLQVPYYLIPDRLKPYQKHLSQIKVHSISQNNLNDSSVDDRVETFYSQNKHAYAITSLKGRFGDALVSLNEKGQFVDHLTGKFAKTWLAK